MFYPIKYAVLELKVNNETFGFIVSKCYLLESTTKYKSNGDVIHFHKVVFPYNNFMSFLISLRNGNKNYYEERKLPRTDICDNTLDYTIVSSIYDNYEDAKLEADTNNQKIKESLLKDVSIPTNTFSSVLTVKMKYDEAILTFNEHMKLCSDYEKYIKLHTEDLLSKNSLDTNSYLNLLRIYGNRQ